MEATNTRTIKSGKEFDYLIPKPGFVETTVQRGATLADTMRFIPKAVAMTKWQTEKLTDTLFRGYDRMESCRRIWQFLYDHIPYKKDEERKEQIRSPRFSWYYRHERGIDCDCYTTFISAILTNLGIPHRLRIAKYKEDHFQHIYPVVPMPDGSYITIDCVVNKFNYEEPYTEIKDKNMDLEFLDGIDDTDLNGSEDLDMLGIDEIEGLYGKKGKGKVFKKIGQGLKKGLHAFNRVNPVTIALRNGLLAAMKLNTMNIAGRLKWSYLTEQQAAAKGIDPVKFQKLKKTREKLEKIFHGAGGKEKNLKNAILKGKGNKDHAVQGLEGYTDPFEMSGLDGMDENTPLRQLLGRELWESENVEGMEEVEGLEGLGELGAVAAIATTTGALTTVSLMLKNIGNIFGSNQQPGAKDFEQGDIAADSASELPLPEAAAPSYSEPEPAPPSSNLPALIPENLPAEIPEEEVQEAEVIPDEEDQENTTEGILSGTPIKAVWEKNKKWLKPTLIGTGGLGLLYLGYRVYQAHQQKKQKAAKKPAQQLSGLPGKKKKKNRKKAKRTINLM